MYYLQFTLKYSNNVYSTLTENNYLQFILHFYILHFLRCFVLNLQIEMSVFAKRCERSTSFQRAHWWRLPYHDGGSLDYFEFRPAFSSLPWVLSVKCHRVCWDYTKVNSYHGFRRWGRRDAARWYQRKVKRLKILLAS